MPPLPTPSTPVRGGVSSTPTSMVPSTPVHRSGPVQPGTPGQRVLSPPGQIVPASPAQTVDTVAAARGTPLKSPPVAADNGGYKYPIPPPLDETYTVTEEDKARILKEKLSTVVPLAKRPGFATGRDAKVNVNCYKVVQYPNKVVYQYDVTIGNGGEKRGLIQSVWQSKRVQAAIQPGWIFDGNKLAWSISPTVPLAPIKLKDGTQEVAGLRWTTIVDLDADKGVAPRKDKNGNEIPNKHRIQIAQTKKLDLHPLEAYLQRKMDFDNSVLEGMSFIDHLLRTGPSKRLLSIKRSFYANTEKAGHHLGIHIYAYKGIYQAARMAQFGDTQGVGHLVINADVNNGCFWGPNVTVLSILTDMLNTNPGHMLDRLIPRKLGHPHNPKDTGANSPAMRQANRLKRLRITVKYKNMPESLKGKILTIEEIVAETAESYMFEEEDKITGEKKKVSIAKYFFKKYGHNFTEGGCLVGTRRGLYPAECCYVVPGQRYPFKLDETQTANMIKFAVTKPDQRAADIQTGINSVNWAGDRYLQHYGLKVQDKMIQTKAKLLQPPRLEFGKRKVLEPKTFGQWKIDGCQFIEPNKIPLKHWGVMQITNFGRNKPTSKGEIEKFLSMMVSEYAKYGGLIENRQPIIMDAGNQDIGNAVDSLFKAVAAKCKPGEHPQLLVFIVNGKAKDAYDRLKKSCDCRFGIVSQVLQNAHVERRQHQYIGNVLMKINAKLGGCTARAIPGNAQPGNNHTYFNKATMVIGADVSHPGPGGLGVSMAALSVSMDKSGIKYAAGCVANGHRLEVIAHWNWDKLVRPLLMQWLVKFNGIPPAHIIYIRDGVSEGQYQQILQLEIRDLKKVWEAIAISAKLDINKVRNIKYTVIIASKRHHIRMFPADGNRDKNNNVLPGTLVERDVTTARDWDFYLCAHKAIQGTARPVHYAVISDEANTPQDYLMKLIYDQSYQYVRSTTSVSIHPAVYYAHLAARRAVAHERDPHGYGRGGTHTTNEELELIRLEEAKIVCDYTGKKMTETAMQRLQYLTEAQYPPLIAMKNDAKIMETMWFV